MTTLQQPALAPDQAVHEQFLALLCQDELGRVSHVERA